jgi:hypothetical protein
MVMKDVDDYWWWKTAATPRENARNAFLSPFLITIIHHQL